MKIFLATLAVSTLVLIACTMDEDPYTKIKFASASEVVGCKQVGNLSSSSKNFGLFNETANEARLKNAKKEAYELNANRIVLNPAEENGNTTTAEGKAYVCP